MTTKLKQRIIELWRDGHELAAIREKLISEGYQVDDKMIGKILGEIAAGLKDVAEEDVGDVMEWLFTWQLERLKKYRELEKQIGLPIPDVRANIALMLSLLDRRPVSSSSVVDKLLEGVDSDE